MTGSITKHVQKNGRISWGYYFRAGKDANGKWIQETKQGFAKKGEAEEALRQAIEGAKAEPAARDPRCFAEFFDAWIREYAERKCEPKTTERYVELGEYAKRHFGNVPIADLTPLTLEKAFHALLDHGGRITAEHPQGRPLSPKTIREIASVVNGTLKTARRWQAIEQNPMEDVELPKLVRKQARALERTQMENVATWVHGHEWLEALIELDAATGCRRGELLALIWPDVDFESRILIVSKSLQQSKRAGLRIKLPKGGRVRRFPLPASAIEVLLKHRERQKQFREAFGEDYNTALDLVLCTPEGNYLKPDSVSSKVSLLMRKLGLPKGCSLHTLRHSHASHLLSTGVSLPAVSKRLGHANPHVTAQIYAHALERDEFEAADAWDRSVGKLAGDDAKRQ
jgi:integrase